MYIRKYCTYTSDNSDLAIEIINIGYVGSDYVKFKGKLFNKKNGIVYETKRYKIPFERLKHWVQLK